MRQRDPKKEQCIRTCAIRMITEHGFDGFSMQKLARAADVSPGTLYIYYENKEDLLQKLYNTVHEEFTSHCLRNFDPAFKFADGLRLQWSNRLNYVQNRPADYNFLEQFRNSPMIKHEAVSMIEFREAMKNFVRNAIDRGEIRPLPLEVYWSMAYGPFYALTRFHINQKSLLNKRYQLDPDHLETLLQLVVKSLETEKNEH